MANKLTKQVISTKVSVDLKEKLVKQAKEKGLTTSEHIANLLVFDFEEKETQYQKEIEKLNSQLDVKDKLIGNMSANLEKAQNLLDQQQQLQLMAQKQIEDLQLNQRLLIETNSRARKWWQVWK